MSSSNDPTILNKSLSPIDQLKDRIRQLEKIINDSHHNHLNRIVWRDYYKNITKGQYQQPDYTYGFDMTVAKENLSAIDMIRHRIIQAENLVDMSYTVHKNNIYWLDYYKKILSTFEYMKDNPAMINEMCKLFGLEQKRVRSSSVPLPNIFPLSGRQ